MKLALAPLFPVGKTVVEVDELKLLLGAGVSRVYPHAMSRAFGDEIDFAQLIKVFGPAPSGKDNRYSPPSIVGTQTRACRHLGDSQII